MGQKTLHPLQLVCGYNDCCHAFSDAIIGHVKEELVLKVTAP